MERIPVELLYVLGFVVFILFNHFLQKAARRRQEEARAEAEAQAQAAAQSAPPPAEEEPLEDLWGRSAGSSAKPAPAPLPAVAAPPAPPPPPVRRRHPVRALLEDRRDLRRAVILMMVLGPCRSQEPPER